MSLLSSMQSAMEKVVWFINEAGTTCTYTPKGGAPVQVKAFVREMGNEELVGDYRQGDLKVEIDALAIPGVPTKYDTIAIGGKSYALRSPGGSPRRAGDTVFTYKFVVRGG